MDPFQLIETSADTSTDFSEFISPSVQPCVGSRVSSFADGSTVAKPDGAIHLPPQILAIAAVLNEFVRSSPLLPYDTTSHDGVWRSATVRWSPSLREAMVIISLQPGKSSVGKAIKTPSVLHTTWSQAPAACETESSLPVPVAATGTPSPSHWRPEAQAAIHGATSTGTDTAIHGFGAAAGNTVTSSTGTTGSACDTGTGTGSVPVSDSLSLSAAAAAALVVLPPPADSHGASAPLPVPVAVQVQLEVTRNAQQLLVISTELERLCTLLTCDPLLCVVSIYGLSYSGLSQPPPNHPHQLLHGRATITEEMCGMRFNVSPSAFFQVNTRAAEILYTIVRDFAVTGTSSTLTMNSVAGLASSATDSPALAVAGIQNCDLAVLDVCCGTGTIGIICSPLVARVVGVELSEGAIEDAKANALLNNIANAVFVCSRAEDVMPRILGLASAAGSSGSACQAQPATQSGADALTHESITSSNVSGSGDTIRRVVAIVDPPRSGLHMEVIKAIR